MKKKIFISLIIILFLLMIFGTILILYFYERESRISLMLDDVVVEYGNTYNPKIEELIDLSKYSFINLQEIRIESNIENENDKDYPAVGEYEINVYYKNKTLKQRVEVKDTIAPEISINNNIEIPYGADLSTYNFKELINVSDLSEIREYNIDYSNVNSNLSGEYAAKVIIEDIYSNKSEKEFKIIVNEKKEDKIIDDVSNKQTNNTVSSTKENEKKTTDNNKNKPINNNNSITNNSNETQESNKNESNQETPKQPVPERCINNNNHSMGVGNSGKWFSNKNEAITYYDNLISYWGNLWESNKIDDATYDKNCPVGYEVWSCMFCSKWTINFYYR